MQRIGLSILFSLVALLACQKQPAADQGAPEGAKKAAAPAAPKAAPSAANDAYTVRIVPGEAKAGAPAQSVIEVTPGPGYKVNLEFPVKLTFTPPEGVAAEKKSFGKGDAEITEKALRFNVPFTPAAVGTVSLSGTADFSVCNDNTCKLIRDEKLAWEVAVK
ncbi:MAG: hypothetical protein KC583_11385 [Myxococcales bacterium]|nr:hypothetical protein [Myxococcales bacterium]